MEVWGQLDGELLVLRALMVEEFLVFLVKFLDGFGENHVELPCFAELVVARGLLLI